MLCTCGDTGSTKTTLYFLFYFGTRPCVNNSNLCTNMAMYAIRTCIPMFVIWHDRQAYVHAFDYIRAIFHTYLRTSILEMSSTVMTVHRDIIYFLLFTFGMFSSVLFLIVQVKSALVHFFDMK